MLLNKKKMIIKPRYIQIADIIREAIIFKELEINDKIPSENELAEQFGVSRLTARHAVTILKDQGYIYRKHGKGAFILNDEPLVEKINTTSIGFISRNIRSEVYSEEARYIDMFLMEHNYNLIIVNTERDENIEEKKY